MLAHYIAKVKANRSAARTAYFRKTRQGTKGINDVKLAKLMIAAGISYYAF
jgi:hypothetical protein